MSRVIVAALAVFMCSCLWPTSPTNVFVSQAVNIGASPAPSASPGVCPVPAAVQLNAGSCASGIRVGAFCSVSATPFLAAGVPSPASCDDVRSVSWQNGPACRVVLSGKLYEPDIQGVAQGVCELAVVVDGTKSGTVTVTVTP